MQMSHNSRVLLAPVILLGLAMAPARADDFYKGKTITIVVGFSPGGGYDAYGRGLARRLSDHVPGNPSVIVQNMPSAGSLTAVRYLDVNAAKDGTVMTIFNPGLVGQAVVQPDKVNLDFRKFAWIGIATPDTRVCYGYGPKGITGWDDMMHRKEFILGATSRGSANYINGATLKQLFHAPIKQVLGFPGSAEMRLGIERGELDGDCGSFSSIPVEWIRDGLAHSFVRFMPQRPAEIPESATYVGDFATTDEQRKTLDLLNATDQVGRPFVMSRQVPPDRVAIMRKAFDDTMKDPAFLMDMEKQELPVDPLTGQQADAIIDKLMASPPEIIAKARQIYE
jgi:tripartite-type tricarboxylate transporter receptor subunit TctC